VYLCLHRNGHTHTNEFGSFIPLPFSFLKVLCFETHFRYESVREKHGVTPIVKKW
jgi:hypothetical protein